jgi:hypothetical protein
MDNLTVSALPKDEQGLPKLPERPEVGRFIGESWEIFKMLLPRIGRLYLQMILYALYVFVPIVVLFIILQVLRRMEIDASFLNDTIINSVSFIFGLVAVVAFVYLVIWMQASMILMVRNRTLEVPVKQLIAEAKPLIGAVFWTSLLSGILTFLWTLLLIIPGIIFGVYYTFAEYIVVDKNVRGMDAIRLSKQYVQGLWWPVVFSLLGLAGVSVLVWLAIQAVGLILGQTAEGILALLFQFGFAPYSVIYMILLYEKLKSLKPEIS